MDSVSQGLPKSIPIPAFLVNSFSLFIYTMNNYVPGGYLVIEYVKKSHHDDPYRTIVELLLFLYGVVYYLSKPKQSKKTLQNSKEKYNSLSKNEIDMLIDEWTPEAIVDDSEIVEESKWRLAKIPVMDSNGIKKYLNMTRDEGKESYKNVFNMSSNNSLALSYTSKEITDEVNKTIKNYGVGACGPAGFYGNQDVHYRLEYDLSEFFGVEGACLYGQDFCVAASALPAFNKRGDIIVADNQISLSLQNALQLSRSTLYYYEHNNMESLENLLKDINDSIASEKLPDIPRKFIVTEGLFANSGDIANLPELAKLKYKYKFRLVVEETLSLGVLGATGRGLSEFYKMNRANSIDITFGSMATAFGSSGGFVLGDRHMTFHQHISSNAYCFSASLPAYTTRIVSKTLEILRRDNSSVSKLNELSKLLHSKFMSSDELSKYVIIKSNENSPILHFELRADFREKNFEYTKEQLYEKLSILQRRGFTTMFFDEYEDEEVFLQKIVDSVLENFNILISRRQIMLKHETLPILPGIRVSVTADMTSEEVSTSADSIIQTVLELCSSL
ncbi:hypothetical protein TPHA_0A05510 [Tetrapisispora phaffii CBS 4417]|uniref:serine C-palmitoyltransferase n=1 Tax=Tetrapisispora phaffii (strain ATCC 24235 / CBS 4417 / NBRC 1672 / NRRL Y-8282 / UCD 70-5) TaxID=1071381 RepID=G8BNZ7_TETPH|nr:hypothetical protein TPHA_0A05510 [Tetrapisispora phaffii CBS 4417]CCE61625.1 hypothetical protein TPHA_0A05510 [Tetrapisispora phaffii CBS 4417]